MIVVGVDPAQVLNLFAAVIFPVLVGLVSTKMTRSGTKAALLAGLSVVSGIATEAGAAIADGTQYDLGSALLVGLGAFVIAVATHYGFWKPTGVSGKAQDAFGGRHAMEMEDEAGAQHLRGE